MIAQRFLIAIPGDWTGRDGVEAAALPTEVCSAGPRVWAGEGTRVVPCSGGGWLIGVVFPREEQFGRGPDVPLLPRGAVRMQAEWLCREYWGAYLAILPSIEGEGLCLFGDPSGLLPVYRTRNATHILLSSDPGLFTLASAAPPAIDWTALRAHLCWPELRATSTCLAGVDELRPGALHRFGRDDRLPEIVWRPECHLPNGPAPVADEAAHALRACAVKVMDAWASLLGPVAVAASGGVDSSLICAALAAASHDFGCITLATADPSGDERRFVETLAKQLNIRTIEITHDPAAIDLFACASHGLPRPARRSLSLAFDAALEAGRTQLGSQVVFDGNGGDNLFCFLHSAAPVIDRLRAEGARAALPTLLEMCAVTGADLPTMMRAAWRRFRRGNGRDPWPADRTLLADNPDEVVLPAALTPWLETPVGIHGGKRDHLALILHAQNHIHGVGTGSVPRFSPLMSQPLVELCLGLPTWLWCTGGINRALARSAFAELLPEAVLRRTAKAGPDSFLRRLFAENRKQLCAMLLGGHLAAQGLLDRPAIEAAMATDILSADPIAYRLLDLVEAEAWVQSWIG